MQPSQVTHPEWIRATCVDCEETRKFDSTAGDSEELVAAFECRECDHRIVLSLDP